MRGLVFTLFVLMLVLGSFYGFAQDLYVYPAKGQSSEQQDKDEWECHKWAIQQSGVDPVDLASDDYTDKTYKRWGFLPGAVAGGALGAIGGTIAKDTGKGAAIGAAIGGILGQASRNKGIQEYQDDQRAKKRMMREYNRAYESCIIGRGYSVK
jgi:hypothetical protein